MIHRRQFLKTTTAVAAVPSVEAADDGLPAPFDEMPTIDNPTDQQRRLAATMLPPRAVPDDGPIPDYYHRHTPTHEIVVPEWALAATRWRLRFTDPQDLDRQRIEAFLNDYAHIRDQYVTPDGRDAVEALLSEVSDE